MQWDVLFTLKLIADSSADIVSAPAADVLVTIDQVDSSCLFLDTTLEGILGMAAIDVVVVKGFDSSCFFGFFLVILNYFTVFWLFAIASVSSFVFTNKVTK